MPPEETQNNPDRRADETTPPEPKPMGPAPDPIKAPAQDGPEPTGGVTAPDLGDVQKELMDEIARGSVVQQPAAIPDTAGGEEKFMEFVAEKSQELPEDARTPTGQVHQESIVDEKPKRSDIIRTYHTDVAETIRDQKLSLANIAVAETKRVAKGLPSVVSTVAEKSRSKISRRVLLNALSILLVLVGIGVLSYLYVQYQGHTVPNTVPLNTLALANANTNLDTTGMSAEAFLVALETTADTATGGIGDVINITVTTASSSRAVAAPELLSLLGAESDPAFLRSVQAPFMLGIHIFDESHLFLILKTTFFENAFAGMLRWEERLADELPFLVRDVPEQTIVHVVPVATSTEETVTTTTETIAPPVPEEILPSGIFEDTIIQNKDVRARRGSDSEIDLLYTFTDPETLIITSNADTLEALLNRLTIARFRQ